MIAPTTPKLNFLVKSRSETRSLSKITRYLFVLFHVVFALDFGFVQFKSRRNKLIVKCLTFAHMSVLAIMLCYTFFVTHPNPFTGWYFAELFVYYAFGINVLVSKNSYHDFQIELHELGTVIGVDNDSYKSEHITLTLFLSLLTFRFVATWYYEIVFDEYTNYPAYAKCGYFIILLGLNIVLLVYSLFFKCVYSLMKEFTTFVRDKGDDVVACHYLYKNIVEVTEKTKKSFDVILVVGLIFVTADATLTMYLPFGPDSIQLGYTLDMPLAYILVVQELVVIFSPAFTAGLLASQVERLRLVLYDRLVKDQKHTKDLKRFINYIEVRPLRFKVWTVVPLDWSLPIIVINICVTYLIVMIQFTHKK